MRDPLGQSQHFFHDLAPRRIGVDCLMRESVASPEDTRPFGSMHAPRLTRLVATLAFMALPIKTAGIAKAGHRTCCRLHTCISATAYQLQTG